MCWYFVFQRTKREWKPLEDRSCTDLPWFLLFTVFCVGMVSSQYADSFDVCKQRAMLKTEMYRLEHNRDKAHINEDV